MDILRANPRLERAGLGKILVVSTIVNLLGRLFLSSSSNCLDTYLSADFSIVAILVTQRNSFTQLPRDSLKMTS